MKKTFMLCLILTVLCAIFLSVPALATGSIAGDFDGNGSVNTDDAVYLLLHVMFGAEDYPLATA